HNEVETIERAAENIRVLVPEARVAVAHGQMRERELEQVMQQGEILRKEDIAPFQLKIGSVDSFSSALFVEVQDIENILSHIRQKLDTVSNEIAALDYCPHITLGLYKKDYSSNLILQKISQLPVQYTQAEFDLKVEHLTFGYYQAQILQGQLYPYQHLFLGDSCCN
ncbi:2'-5' RNA ligase family protein, partial [Acinetobacter baumannii]|uniref:2'-5' RNA ligase family protein n=1 Tax=Acinetobacter baumannii TaxID=470 RepID=UPI001D0DFE6E